MPAASPLCDPLQDAAPADGWERALLDRQLERLDRLADMGMDIAGAIHRRVLAAEAEPGAPPPTGAMLGFDRVARAVRQAFALQSRLIADYKGKPAKPSAAAAEEGGYDGPPDVFWLAPDPYHEKIVEDAVRRAAQAEGCETEAVERLVLDSVERLARDDIWGLVTTLPFEEIVALICKDLGLGPEGDGLARFTSSHIAAAMGRGGPPAERSEEQGVEGAGGSRHAAASPVRDSS